MASGGNTMQSINTWTDLSGFSALRQSAQADSKAALPAVARQFESIFTQMMLKSMRDANYGDPLFQSQAGDAWQGLFDQQLSVSLSSQGHGLGIADMLIRQLGGKDASPKAAADITDPATSDQAGTNALENDWRQRLGSVADAARSIGQSVSRWIPDDAQEFVSALAPFAAQAARKLGVSLRAVLSQAALETQWGKRMPTRDDGSSSNNLFGMKAGGSWDGERVNVPTLEFEDGVGVRRHAQFRAYGSAAESFADYARLLGGNSRYAEALGKGDDVLGFARGLVNGGYATDPTYASKVAAIANSPAMRQALAALKNVVEKPTPSR
ncbi:flagellar assembly peptidoglycan hydrolase FlgJ [Rhodanobacter sp. Col0626]|uniref:flagellar assembly peptidoglycan hydrolase FlgJ n=1 Tax=Rhodanobacter sp. Col0626 TaxID=3415679 RepID=UPI003CFB46A2